MASPHIYHIPSSAIGSHGRSKPAGRTVALVLPSWAPSWICTANLGCPGALGRQVGLPRHTWTPFWAPTGLQLGLQVPPGVPRTVNFVRQYGTLATFSNIGFCALQVLLDLPFGTSWALLGHLLGSTWGLLAPLGLNLGSLGRL